MNIHQVLQVSLRFFKTLEGISDLPYDKYVDRKIPQNIQERKTFGVIFWISQASDDTRDIIADVSNFNNTER